MKRMLLIMLSIVLTFVFCFSVNTLADKSQTASKNNAVSRYTVVIDAGHGGADAGTIGIDGSLEKGINLSIAKALYDYLMVSGINAVLIRDGDYEFYKEKNYDRSRSDLYNRLDFVNSIPNSALISIHQNHFENEAEWGTQVWYSANNEESRIIADSILENIKGFLQPDNKRENKESDNSYYLLYKAKAPSVMVECGFMSNALENQKLQDSAYQKDMAFSILSGVCNIV